MIAFFHILMTSMVVISFVCAVKSVVPLINSQDTSDSQLFRDSPIVMTHDSASGYIMDSDHFVKEEVIKYTKTQSANIVGQLVCGARAFDYRPYIKRDGTVVAHHGPVVIPHEMGATLDEITQWVGEHGDMDEVVLLYVSHIDGHNCTEGQCTREPVKEVLNLKGISYMEDCSALESLTYSDAVAMGKLGDGRGSVLALFDCVSENYDDTVNCYGSVPGDNRGKFVCYGDDADSRKDIPMYNMQQYLTNATGLLERPSTGLWMNQAHWQSTTESISLGLLHNSSVTLDEIRSGLNAQLAVMIRKGAFPSLNLLELDEVCDGGADIRAALQERAQASLGR